MCQEKQITNAINKYFSRWSVERKDSDALIRRFEIKKYSAGDTILNMGERSDYVCLILKGIVRGFYIDDEGREITKCFSLENDWCCSYNLLTGENSPFYIEALEDTSLARITLSDIRRIVETYPKIKEIQENIMRNSFLASEKRVLTFAGMDAKQRYLKFCEENKEICERVKQEFIASYLGITPSSLSRIKRELSRESV